MNLNKKQLSFLNVVRGWSESDVINYLKNNNLEEYLYFAKEKTLDGYKLLSLSDGIIAMWRPKVDHKKIMNAIEDLIKNPENYLENKQSNSASEEISIVKIKPIVPERSNLLKDKLKSSQTKTVEVTSDRLKSIDKNIKPPKSFLYGGKVKVNVIQCNAYAPMNNMVDSSNLELANDNSNSDVKKCQDRGYYEMTNQVEKSSANNSEDNPYEELNFEQTECDKKKIGILKRILRQPTAKKYSEEVKQGRKSKLAKVQSSTISNYNIHKIDLEDDFSNATSELKSYRKIADSSEDIVHNKSSVTMSMSCAFPEYSEINENDTSGEVVESVNYTEMNIAEVKMRKSNNSDGKRSRQTSDYADTDIVEEETVESESKLPEITSKSNINEGADNLVQSNLIQLDEMVNEAPMGVQVNKMDVDFEKFGIFSDEHFYETPEMREDLLEMFYTADGYVACNISGMGIVVEDYLEPRKCFHDSGEAAMDSLAEEMMKLFDANMTAKQSDLILIHFDLSLDEHSVNR